MWHGWGNGATSSRGTVQHFGNPAFLLAMLSSQYEVWPHDTSGIRYRSKGYAVSVNETPVFIYEMYGAKISDSISVSQAAEGIDRVITVHNPPAGLYVRLVNASKIESLNNGIFLIDDKSYFLRLNAAEGEPIIRSSNGRKELMVSIKDKISYTILF